MEALENFYLPELGDEVTILESPKATRLNGQWAATALVSYPGLIEFGMDMMGTHVTRMAVTGPDRFVYVQAMANEESATEYQSTFDLMLDSIVVGSQLPPPGIGKHIEAPADYIDYQDQKTGLGFSYPSE